MLDNGGHARTQNDLVEFFAHAKYPAPKKMVNVKNKAAPFESNRGAYRIDKAKLANALFTKELAPRFREIHLKGRYKATDAIGKKLRKYVDGFSKDKFPQQRLLIEKEKNVFEFAEGWKARMK